ncbi:MAG: CNNM domain-containing protein [Planctomycetota bacterium]
MLSSIFIASAAVPATSGDGSMFGLIFFVSIALGVSFVCSVLEAVLLSTTSSYLELAIQKGSRAAERMRRHKEHQNIDRSISAILTLNTIAHTVGATGAGAEAAAIFGSEWIGVIGAVLTLLILIVSEIIPKTIGAVYWRGLLSSSAISISILVWTLYPIVWACQFLTDILKPKGTEPTVTRAELEILARVGQKEGTILARESRVVRNLLRLHEVRTSDILTPRTVVYALSSTTTLEEAAREKLRFSRIPIYTDDKDSMGSFVLRHDILEGVARNEGARTVAEIARPLNGVPETTSVAQLLDLFIDSTEHVFLVVDEYGGTEGIVTLEDAIESLLGAEITDETDPVTDMRQLAQRRQARKHRDRGDADNSAP